MPAREAARTMVRFLGFALIHGLELEVHMKMSVSKYTRYASALGCCRRDSPLGTAMQLSYAPRSNESSTRNVFQIYVAEFCNTLGSTSCATCLLKACFAVICLHMLNTSTRFE